MISNKQFMLRKKFNYFKSVNQKVKLLIQKYDKYLKFSTPTLSVKFCHMFDAVIFKSTLLSNENKKFTFFKFHQKVR